MATSEIAISTKLVIRRKVPKIPKKVLDLMRETRATWSIGGEEFESALKLSQVIKQLSCGFYYRWVWPNGEPDFEWLEARAGWHRELREKLKRSTTGMDSPLLLAQAAERHRLGVDDDRPVWASETWDRWRLVKDQKPPPVEAVWVDDFLVDAALDWATKNDGIIWYELVALGERIAGKGGLPLYGAGADAGEATENKIVCSITTQGTGKNLQRHSQNLFTTVPPNGTRMEQTLGRTHRPGQKALEVAADWFGHTDELNNAMERAMSQARYMEETTGQTQKLLYATHER